MSKKGNDNETLQKARLDSEFGFYSVNNFSNKLDKIQELTINLNNLLSGLTTKMIEVINTILRSYS